MKACKRCGVKHSTSPRTRYCKRCQEENHRDAARRHNRARFQCGIRPRARAIDWKRADGLIRQGVPDVRIAEICGCSAWSIYNRRRVGVPPATAPRERICNEATSSMRRDRYDNFHRYMLANPVYFEDVFRVPCNPANVAAEWRRLA